MGKEGGKRAIIIAPLTVARQTVREAKKLVDADVQDVRSMDEIKSDIVITNYEMAEHLTLYILMQLFLMNPVF